MDEFTFYLLTLAVIHSLDSNSQMQIIVPVRPFPPLQCIAITLFAFALIHSFTSLVNLIASLHYFIGGNELIELYFYIYILP